MYVKQMEMAHISGNIPVYVIMIIYENMKFHGYMELHTQSFEILSIPKFPTQLWRQIVIISNFDVYMYIHTHDNNLESLPD